MLLSGTPAAYGETPARPTEVVVIATQHFISDMPEGYTPGHLRTLLEKVAPQLLAVEAPANVDDPWASSPYELATITRPWAEEHRVKIAPAGIHEPNYLSDISGGIGRFNAKDAEAFAQLELKTQKEFPKYAACEAMNSAGAHELWRSYHAQLHAMFHADTPWETWNAKIAERIERLCKSHPGERVAVVFGGAHAYYLLDHLGASPAIKIVSVKSFFPLSDDEVARRTLDIGLPVFGLPGSDLEHAL